MNDGENHGAHYPLSCRLIFFSAFLPFSFDIRFRGFFFELDVLVSDQGFLLRSWKMQLYLILSDPFLCKCEPRFV